MLRLCVLTPSAVIALLTSDFTAYPVPLCRGLDWDYGLRTGLGGCIIRTANFIAVVIAFMRIDSHSPCVLGAVGDDELRESV